MAKSKKWRLYVLDTQEVTAYPALSEIYLYETSGGPNIASQAEVSTSGGPGSVLTDESSDTYWQSSYLRRGWVEFEFDSPVEITEYTVRVPSLSDVADDAHPLRMVLEREDGALVWKVVDFRTGLSSWGDAGTKTYTASFTDNGYVVDNKVRFKFAESNYNPAGEYYLIIREMEFRETVSGSDWLSADALDENTSDPDPTTGTLPDLYDDNPGSPTQFRWDTGGAYQYLVFDISVPMVVTQYGINVGKPTDDTSPKTYTFEISYDGVSWHAIDVQTNLTTGWTDNVLRVFTLPSGNYVSTSGGVSFGGAAVQNPNSITGSGGVALGGAAGVEGIGSVAVAMSVVGSDIDGSVGVGSIFPEVAMSGTGQNSEGADGAFSLPLFGFDGVGNGGSVGEGSAKIVLAVLGAGQGTHTGTCSVGMILSVVGEGSTPSIADGVIEAPSLIIRGTGNKVEAETYSIFVINPRNYKVTTYSGIDMESLCEYAGVTYIANSSGIHAMTGDLDGAETITSQIKTGITDFGTDLLKRVEALKISARSAGTLELVTVSREEVERRYPVDYTGRTGVHNRRRRLGNSESETWQIGMGNVDGADFDLIALVPEVSVLSRSK